SGFASVRRFNALFKARYRMPPGRLREARGSGGLPAALVFELAYRPPYDGDAYARTVAIEHRGVRHVGRVEVRRAPRRSALRIAVSPSLARAVPAVLSRVKHTFDLSCDPALVAAALGTLADARPGLRVPGTFDGFELAVRAIVGQQISVRAARTMVGRIANAFGDTLADGEGTRALRLFPDAARVSRLAPEELTALGLT